MGFEATAALLLLLLVGLLSQCCALLSRVSARAATVSAGPPTSQRCSEQMVLFSRSYRELGDRLRLYNSTTNEQLLLKPGMNGAIFEQFAIHNISLSKTLRCSPLQGEGDEDWKTVALENLQIVYFDEDIDIKPHLASRDRERNQIDNIIRSNSSSTNESSSHNNSVGTEEITGGPLLWIPRNKAFPTVDALLTIGAKLWLVSVTVGKSHTIVIKAKVGKTSHGGLIPLLWTLQGKDSVEILFRFNYVLECTRQRFRCHTSCVPLGCARIPSCKLVSVQTTSSLQRDRANH